MNILNEEISAIQRSIVLLKKGIALETNQSKKNKMENDVKELNRLLNFKLGKDNNYEY